MGAYRLTEGKHVHKGVLLLPGAVIDFPHGLPEGFKDRFVPASSLGVNLTAAKVHAAAEQGKKKGKHSEPVNTDSADLLKIAASDSVDDLVAMLNVEKESDTPRPEIVSALTARINALGFEVTE